MTSRPARGGWRSVAACDGLGPDLFFDPDPLPVSAAQAICDGCRVRSECAEHATVTAEPYGVWGGLTEAERAPTTSSRPGRPRDLSDADLIAIFRGADDSVRAVEVLRRDVDVHLRTVYKLLARAERLGVVERRDGGLYPTRRR